MEISFITLWVTNTGPICNVWCYASGMYVSQFSPPTLNHWRWAIFLLSDFSSIHTHTHLQVYYQPTSSNVESSIVVPDYTPGDIYTLEGLSPNTMYNIHVTASTNGGEGEGARATEITKFGGSQRPINHLTHILLHALPLCIYICTCSLISGCSQVSTAPRHKVTWCTFCSVPTWDCQCGSNIWAGHV